MRSIYGTSPAQIAARDWLMNFILNHPKKSVRDAAR